MSRTALRACSLFFLISFHSACAWSDVPVVDDHENLALLEEQSIYPSASVTSSDDAMTPLAHDDEHASDTLMQGNQFNTKLQALQQELAELRGRMDEQAHEILRLKEQCLGLGSPGEKPEARELTQKLQTLPVDAMTTTPPASVPAQATPLTAIPSQDETKRYVAAYELLKHKQFSEALNAMKAFVYDFPEGNYVANAHYWLGELYLHDHQYTQAMEQFDLVLAHPSSNKYSASLLKKAYVLVGLQQIPAAKKLLQDVESHYPDTPVAHLAHKKLATIDTK